MSAFAETVRPELEQFACPRCGAVRPISRRAARAIRGGQRSGECAPGSGCRAALDEPELLRRWWLQLAGVEQAAIVRAGSAARYVVTHGVPARLVELAGALEAWRSHLDLGDLEVKLSGDDPDSACSGCGCALDERTLGCRPCESRANARRRRHERRELSIG